MENKQIAPPWVKLGAMADRAARYVQDADACALYLVALGQMFSASNFDRPEFCAAVWAQLRAEFPEVLE